MKKQLQTFKNRMPRMLAIGLLLLMVLSTGRTSAQTANLYSFSNSSGVFTPLVGATSSSLAATADGGMSTNIPIGFSFVFEGITYTDLRVSADGFLVFGTAGTTTLTNNLATTTATQRPGVAGIWDDLQCTVGVKYLTSGTAPNRTFTAEWLNMEWNYNSGTAAISFQIILYETTNTIDIIYRQEATSINTGSGGASIGIMGVSPSNFISVQDVTTHTISRATSQNGIVTKPATGQIYTFTPPPACAGSPTAQATNIVPTSIGKTSLEISYTDASPAAAGQHYLVVRYPAGATPTNPTDGVYYNSGQALGAGTVVALTPSSSNISLTGLKIDTTYNIYVYSASVCGPGGPFYLTNSTPSITLSTLPISRVITTGIGGNWSSPSTWVGNAVPVPQDTVEVVAGSTLTIDVAGLSIVDMEVSGTVNYGTTPTSFTVTRNLTVTGPGILNIANGSTGKTINVAGNFTNDGTVDLSQTGSVLVLNGTTPQTIAGSGLLTASTIASLTFNNTSANRTINFNWPSTIISGTLTFTSGWVALGALNSMTLGTSGTTLGTLTYTSGNGFTSGKFGRWFGTTGSGTTIAASTIPTFGVGSFPFILGNGNACHFHRATAALTTPGIFSVEFNGAIGTGVVGSAPTESSLTFDQKTNTTWTVVTSGGYASTSDHSFALQGQGTYTAFSTNARLLITDALQGTHQAGTTQPMVQRTAVPAASVDGVYAIGVVGSEIPNQTVASGAWDNAATWSTGVPVCGQNLLINAADSIWLTGSMAAASSGQIQLNGKLNVLGSSLTVGCTDNNSSFLASGRLYVEGGTLNINGSLSLTSTALFRQTGGFINVDGNAGGILANSVPSGTPLVSIATGSDSLSGGIFTIVDPHAGTTSANNNRAFYYTGGTAINNTTGWTLKFGDGVSTDAGGAVATPVGFVLDMAGSKIVVDSLVIHAGLVGTNRFVTMNNSSTLGCNSLYISTLGDARVSSAVHIAKNLTNNGILYNTAGAITFGRFLSATASASPNAQVISGTGGFRNSLTSSTASFTTLTINNNNPAGVTFAADSVLRLGSGSNTGTVSGTFTITNGIINTGIDTFVLGVSTGTTGTLSYTAGGFGSGSTFARWWGTAAAGQTITASSVPTAGVGTYPFVTILTATPSLVLNSRIAYIRQATASTAGGKIVVKHNNAIGMSAAAITDGAYTVSNLSNANWQVGTIGITGSPTYTIALSAQNIYQAKNTNGRITLASTAISGTHQTGTTLPHLQRATVTLADMTNTWYVGANSSDVLYSTIASGNWEDPLIWNKNLVPSCTDSVVIDNGHSVTVNATAANAKMVTINNTGLLTVSGSSLTVGCTLNNANITIRGKLAVTGGTLTVNGSIFNDQPGKFHQSGGAIIVDGNDNNNASTSASGHQMDMYATTDTSVVFTGGTITIVDPTVNGTSVAFKIYPSQPVNFGLGHTLIFGDGISTQPGGANAFNINLFNTGTGLASLGNVVVNAPSGTNRFVNTSNTIGILGNLTITTGNYRMTSAHTVKGNIVNNDTLVNTSTLTLADPINAVTANNTSAQSITGTGKFLNANTSPTAGTTNLLIRNSSAGGVTIGTKLSVSGTLTLTRGIVNTNATDSFRLGSATAAGTLVGGTDSAYIQGPFYRTFAASRNAVGTYNQTTLFPVGKGGRYLGLMLDPTTNAGGPIVLSGEAFTTNAGTMGAGTTSMSSIRWETFVGAGNANFVGTHILLSDTAAAFNSNTKMVYAPSAAGAYVGIIPPVTFSSTPQKILYTLSQQILAADFTGYYAYGELTPCSTPSNQPTTFVVSNLGATLFDGSFTAATSSPSHYLVVRYPSGGIETPPVNNTIYTVNGALGTGTVVANTTVTSFSQTGLSANTTYDYYIYAYNNSGCFGPVYNTSSPLFASVITCASPVTTPITATAVNVTNNSITPRWSTNPAPGATYLLDVSTNVGFTSFLPGYQNFSTGTDTFTVITGLSASTNYFYRVRAVDGLCSSPLSSSQTVSTYCDPVSSLPWTENFDALATVGTTSFPGCWTKTNGDWATAVASAYNTPRSGANYLRDSWSATDEYMWTPGFAVTAGTTYTFSFWVQGDGYTNWTVDIFGNTAPIVTGATAIGTPYTPAGPGAQVIQPYVKREYSFTAASTGIYYMAIRVNCPSATPWYIAFDDFRFELTVPPTVSTSSINSITQSSATVRGNIVATGGSPITTSGIVIGTSSDPAIGDPGVIDSTSVTPIQGGTYSFNLIGLSSATLYHVRAYAINVMGTSYGPDSTFTTLAAPILPVVTTSSATDITTSTARLFGNVTSNGGDPVTASGIVYSTTTNPAIGDPGVIDSTTTPLVDLGAFNINPTGLSHSTKYYFRAYATNSVGTAYSALDSFTTGIMITAFPYTQNFESGTAGWSTVAIAGSNNWVLGTPAKTNITAAHSGANAWVTKLTGAYDNSINNAVVSPTIDFSALTNPVLRFYHKFGVEANYDALVVEVSLDGGASWTRLDSTLGTGDNFNTPNSYAWYSTASTLGATTGFIQPPKFTSAVSYAMPTHFSSNNNGWIESATPITGAAGQSNVKIRFRFGADGSGNAGDGWAIDDIEIVDVTTPTTPASAVNLTAIGNTTTTVNWTNGDGQGRLVVARLTTTPAVPPTDNVMKSAIAPVFGTSVDSTGLGNYIVYKNNTSSVAVGGLDILTDYTYDVYEFNGKYMHVKYATAASNNGTTLPVTLTSFAANVKGADAILTWTTASEINNSGFEVQRSVDGRNFEKAAFVKGAGNSNKALNYSLTDAKAFAVAKSNVVYYRLKQIDFDGKYTYSQVVRVAKNAEAVNALSVYPNPYASVYSVSFTAAKEGMATIEMVDLQGKVVATKSAAIINGNNMVPMTEVTNLEAGVYFVRLTVNGETQMTKLVKN